MKKFIFSIIALLGILMPNNVWAEEIAGSEGTDYNEAYAVLVMSSGEDTGKSDAYLTLYYDNKKSEHNEGAVVDLDKMTESPEIMQSRQYLHSVIFDQSFADCRPTSTKYWFANCWVLKTISGLEYLNTSEVTDMGQMFMECSELESIDLSHFNTSKVTNMNNMFYRNMALTSLDLSSFDTQNVTDMGYMFGMCENLTTIYVSSNWTTATVTTGDAMFYECPKLVGGNGTTYDENHTDYSYAHIDRADQPGYFTYGESSGEKKEQVATPTWEFQNEMLALSTETADASIYYATANWENEAETDSIANTIDVSTRSTLYQNPIEITDNVIIKMIAAKEGMENSEVATFIYDYKSWRDLYDVIRYGVDVLEKAKDNANVEEGLLEELRWALNEGDMMYQRRAEMSNQEAKYFTDAIVNLCKKIEDQMSSESHQDGDTFTANTVEGTPLIFKIISEADKTCQVGNGIYNGTWGSVDIATAVDTAVVCKITIPEIANGYKVIEVGFEAFINCKHLTSLVIPNTVTKITHASLSHTGLTSITIPSSVTELDYDILHSCDNLESIIVEEGNPIYDSRENCNAIIETATTTLITGCRTSMVPEGITKIGSAAFIQCRGLKTISLPNTVTSIDTQAFNSGDLNYIELPNSLEYIGYGAFAGSQLTSIVLPASLKEIGYVAFCGISTLTSLVVDPNNTIFDSRDNCNAIIETATNKLVEGIGVSIIPSSVTSIGSYAFCEVNNLNTITIPSSITSIGEYAFYHVNLDTINSEIVSPFEITQNVFLESVYNNATLNVPVGSAEAYRNTPAWSNFRNVMEIGESTATATYENYVLTVEGETTMAQALEQVGGRNVVAKNIAAIVWNSSQAITRSDIEGFGNPNLLIYVQTDSLAPEGVNNVVINGKAKSITLVDAESNNNFYAPMAFTAESISYTREFKQTTEKDVSRGWEGICLPFTVQKFTHESHGEIAPFGNDASIFHFWLHQMTDKGMVNATTIEANKPYIISMPNNGSYPEAYNQAGKVTFSAENVTVPVSDNTAIWTADGTIGMMSTYLRIEPSEYIYALNVGSTMESYAEGSVFVQNLREVKPFEVFTFHEENHHEGAGARFISVSSLFGGEGTTGIIDVMKNAEPNGETWYDLNGRRLQSKPVRKGVYIKNGKKVVVK